MGGVKNALEHSEADWPGGGALKGHLEIFTSSIAHPQLEREEERVREPFFNWEPMTFTEETDATFMALTDEFWRDGMITARSLWEGSNVLSLGNE